MVVLAEFQAVARLWGVVVLFLNGEARRVGGYAMVEGVDGE